MYSQDLSMPQFIFSDMFPISLSHVLTLYHCVCVCICLQREVRVR